MVRKSHKIEKLVRDPKNSISQVMWRIQHELMPDHALEFVAINMMTGEYVLADTPGKAMKQFEAKWPRYPSYLCRVDGGGAYRL